MKPLVTTILSFAAAAWGCSSAPVEREEDAKMPERPRVLQLDIDPGSEASFGTREDWHSDISRVLQELNACTAVWTPEMSAERRPDMVLRLDVRTESAGGDAQVRTEGALLDFLAWSTLPLLPLWIRDVDVDPGVTLEATCSDYCSRAGAKPEEVLESKLGPIPCPSISSCHLDRHAIISWSSLGGIFVPPFVFKSPDREHFAGSAGSRVREEVALALGRMVKSFKSVEPPEPFRSLRLEPNGAGLTLVLDLEPQADLLKLDAGLEEGMPPLAGQTEPRPVLSLRFDYPEGSAGRLKPIPLDGLVPLVASEEHLLRIEATDRRGLTWRYSLPVRAEGGQHSAP